MAKRKMRATVMAADGAGGLAQVHDRRFQADNWPIQFEVPREQADDWLRYQMAACERRGWSRSGMSQMEARQNSGSGRRRGAGEGVEVARALGGQNFQNFGDSAFNLTAARLLAPEIGREVAIERTVTVTPRRRSKAASGGASW